MYLDKQNCSMSLLEISYTPENFGVYSHENSIVVVNDIFRATTAMCTAFESGVKGIIPVFTVEEAREYKNKGYLVGAERNGVKLDGFDFGNSPFDYMDKALLKDQVIVMTTTNGTRAINMAKGGHQLVIGSFSNLTAISEWLAKQNRDVIILCSGWKGRINLEDTLFAGALTEALVELGAFNLQSEVEDSGLLAMYSYQLAKDDPYLFLMNSSHRRRLKNLNLKEDIRFALTPDTTKIIPVLKDGVLVAMGEEVRNKSISEYH